MTPEALLVTEEMPVPTTTLDYHRGPKVDPRWPVTQQVFLGPIPMSISWDEIRNVFYTKVSLLLIIINKIEKTRLKVYTDNISVDKH